MIASKFVSERFKLIKVIRGLHMVATPEAAFDGRYVLKENLIDGTLKNKFRARPYHADKTEDYFCNLFFDCPSIIGDPCPSHKCRPFENYWRGHDIGFLTGSINGIVIVDIDPRNIKDFTTIDALLKKVERIHGKLPKTWTAISGRGGLHFYYKYSHIYNTNKGKLIEGVDILGENSWAKMPPYGTKHGNYTWKHDPDITELATLPGWLVVEQAHKIESKRPIMNDRKMNLVYDQSGDRALVNSAITHIPITAAYDHNTFYTMGYALCSSGYADVFKEWSETDGDRKKWVTQSQINLFSKKGSINLGSFFNIAKGYGYDR